MTRVAICAPSRPLPREAAALVVEIAADFPDVGLQFHEQCFREEGHFAGSDAERLAAFVECANDPSFDAVWFARGGYGAGRIAEAAIAALGPAAQNKQFLGYSDSGMLLAGLYRAGIGQPIHASMPGGIGQARGEAGVRRVLAWLSGDERGREPSRDGSPAVAFNLTTLAMLCGTPLLPDLAGHVVMVEEVCEHLYAIDRLFGHVAPHLRGIAGLRLGRISEVPENDRPFGSTPEQIARYWCERYAVPYLGSADIGHDADNKIVPFGA